MYFNDAGDCKNVSSDMLVNSPCDFSDKCANPSPSLWVQPCNTTQRLFSYPATYMWAYDYRYGVYYGNGILVLGPIEGYTPYITLQFKTKADLLTWVTGVRSSCNVEVYPSKISVKFYLLQSLNGPTTCTGSATQLQLANNVEVTISHSENKKKEHIQ